MADENDHLSTERQPLEAPDGVGTTAGDDNHWLTSTKLAALLFLKGEETETETEKSSPKGQKLYCHRMG